MVAYQPMKAAERQKLIDALRGNADSEKVLLMGTDTGFVGSQDELPSDSVASAIKSVPTHY